MVPEPWMPVAVEREGQKIGVKVWARLYEFDHFPLPYRITRNGVDLLAAPVHLFGTTDIGELQRTQQGVEQGSRKQPMR